MARRSCRSRRGFEPCRSPVGMSLFLYYIYIYIYMRRFGEYTSNRHNISVALGPHGMLK